MSHLIFFVKHKSQAISGQFKYGLMIEALTFATVRSCRIRIFR